MNLTQFFSQRSKCPFCEKQLVYTVLPNRRQCMKYEGDRCVVLIDMNGLHKNDTDYKVGLSFGMEDNSFQVEFYAKDGTAKYCDAVPAHLIEKFHKLNRALNYECAFVRKCETCYRYYSCSNILEFNFKSQKLDGEIELNYEFFSFVKSTEDPDVAKIICLVNQYDKSNSLISYHCGSTSTAVYNNIYPDNSQTISLPLIPFVSVEETSQRISNLITFS